MYDSGVYWSFFSPSRTESDRTYPDTTRCPCGYRGLGGYGGWCRRRNLYGVELYRFVTDTLDLVICTIPLITELLNNVKSLLISVFDLYDRVGGLHDYEINNTELIPLQLRGTNFHVRIISEYVSRSCVSIYHPSFLFWKNYVRISVEVRSFTVEGKELKIITCLRFKTFG